MSGSAKKRALTLRRNASEIHLLNTIETLHDHVEIDSQALSKAYNVKASQLMNIHTTEQFIVVRPTTTVSAAAYSGGGQTNFRFHRDVNLIAKNAYLRLQLTNTGGAPITLGPAPLLLNYYELYANSSQEIQRVYGDQVYEDVVMYSNFDQRTNQVAILNMNATTYAENAALGAGASIDYYIPLPSFLNQSPTWMGAFRKDLEWRIYLDPNSIVLGVATDVQVDDMEIIVDCERLDEVQVDKQMKIYSKKVDHRYLYYQQQIFNMTVNASTQYTLDLQALNGIIPYLTWHLRSSITGAGKYTYADLNGTAGRGGIQQLLDENNSTLTNGFDEQINRARGIIYPKHYDSGFALTRFINIFTFSMDPESAIKGGQNLGYQVFHENKVRFTPAAGWVNGTYNIYFHARQFAVLSFMPNGDVMVQRS